MSSPFELFNAKYTLIVDKCDKNKKIDQSLVANLLDIKTGLSIINQFASQYDYRDITGNGYHSFISICSAFCDLILDLFNKNKLTRINTAGVEMSGILLTLTNMLMELKADSDSDEVQANSDGCESTVHQQDTINMYARSDEIFLKMLTTFRGMISRLSSIYGLYCGFWLCPSLARAMKAFTTIMAIYATNSAKSSFKCVLNHNYRGNILAQIAHSTNVHFIKSFWSLTEYSFIRDAVSNIFTLQPKIVKDVYIKEPLQSSYIIPSLGEMVVKITDPELIRKGNIRCRLLYDLIDSPGLTAGNGGNSACNNEQQSSLPPPVPQPAPPPSPPYEALILHCHGGGFVSQSPNSHEVYLRDWSKQLPGIPILSVDYILSPEGKYPEALQQILDVYLWLIDESNTQVKDEIGFFPKKIILAGDSAGGNLITALCLVLNDIRLNYQPDLIMPVGLLCVYTPLMLKLLPSPSRMLTAFDTILPMGVLLSCLEAYIDTTSTVASATSDDDKSLINDASPGSGIVDSRTVGEITKYPSCDKSDEEIDETEQELFKFAQLNFLTDNQKSEEESNGDDTDDGDGNQLALTTESFDSDFVFINKEDIPDDKDIMPSSYPGSGLICQFPNTFSYKFQRGYYKTINQIKTKFFGSSLPSLSSTSSQLSFDEVVKNLASYGQKPFYQETGDTLTRKIETLNTKGSCPYVSPMLYKDFTSLSDVSIALVAGQYDVFLDDSISFSKKWKGHVFLDICPSLPHGFLNFIMFSEEAKQASDLCVKRIRQLLKNRKQSASAD